MKAEATGSLISVNIDGKPLEKLIEVVSNGIGTLYRPRRIRKDADAQAYAIKVLEKAKAEAEADSIMIEIDTVKRIGERLVAKELKRQENIDTIVEMAANNLTGVQVSDKPVDKDWASRFFDIVQDVSRKEMKILWAKILAKEIERPSSYSMRTLELLRNISFEEAELFVKLSDFVLKHNGCFIYLKEDDLNQFGLSYIDLAKLREAGLLHTGEMVTKTFISNKKDISQPIIIYGEMVVFLTIQPNTKNIVMPVMILTQAGREIYELVEHKDNIEYLKSFAAFIKKTNETASVKYGRILELNENQVKYQTPLIEL